VSLLVAGFDETGPSLYQVDPSGSYFAWKATAIGKNMINARTFLEKRYIKKKEIILRTKQPISDMPRPWN
jgi:20S proteasome subunit alpha 2